MTVAQSLIHYFILPVIGLVIVLIIAEIIVSWLVAFGIINLRNPTARAMYQMLNRLVSPMVQPVRSVLPTFGGLDFAPFVVIVFLQWLHWLFRFKIWVMLG